LEREKLAALKQFAYGLSHEINNPLTNIATRAQMLLAGETDPTRRKSLETINAQAFRAFEMIADLMLFAHPPALSLTQFNLRELLEDLIRQYLPSAREQQTELSLVPSVDRSIDVTADRAQIAAAIGALVKNSLEALRTGGEVSLSVSGSERNDGGTGFGVTVCDNGPGISPEIRRHLFDPFFSGREAGRGLGLGLSKAWRIAELHGGEIIVDSEPGQGSRFTVRIPHNPENPPVAD
jgi:signal transduction histidine kinase